MVLGVTEYSFAIQGELDGLEVAGTMQSPDTEEALEFTGEIGVDGSISAAFDTPWVNDKEEELPLVGRWEAAPTAAAR